MPTDVIMPQMGESITEGTITKWRRTVGDTVERDDPLFDISTDKVDTEVPAALTGRLVEILVGEGETVEVNAVVARIAAEGESWSEGDEAPSTEEAQAEPRGAADPGPGAAGEAAKESGARRRPRSSPLVRRMAREHGVDLAIVPGTGEDGRVSKQDMLAFLERRDGAPTEEPRAEGRAREAWPPAVEPTEEPLEPAPGDRAEPLSRMRRSIAEHMVRSRRTAAHVTTVFEVDMSRVEAIRAARSATFEVRTGVRLTPTPFIASAAIEALGAFPILNASLREDHIVHHRGVNLGIAVSLPDGLIVPVLRGADERNFVGIARGIADLAARARAGELVPTEVQGGTFTITNPGPYGALFGTPIIAQPQSAILGVGGVHKRPVVVENDAIAVRSRVLLALSFDHRLIDGVVADQFMSAVKSRLENWPEDELGP